MKFAEIYIPVPSEKSFTYFVPEGMKVEKGIRVSVPVGKRKMTGYVISVHNDIPSGFVPKEISGIVDVEPIFGDNLIKLAHFISKNYICGPGEFFSQALPSGTSSRSRFKNPLGEPNRYTFTLSEEQRIVKEKILQDADSGKKSSLIFGVTGSGKTEVYIEIAREMISRGKSVIYLVPEISLSTQIFERLYNYFGEDLVLYHSGLSKNYRFFNWMRFFNGDAKIAIGTRSSVFMQCPNLGLIIIDEEQDGSYKENSHPRYSARRVAFFRSKNEDGLLVLGSATPSVESFFAAKSGVIGFHVLKNRYGGAELPEIEIVKINSSEPKDIISSKLKLYTMGAARNGFQSVYLLNRRGYSPVILCRDCKESLKCPNCDINLNLHGSRLLICHYCGHTSTLVENCPSCGSDDIVIAGSGTQRVEETVEKVFSGLRVFRMDQDSSKKSGTTFAMVEKMKSSQIDILLGTQMVSKGFDFKSITVVGILLADIGMNLPDFRATERVFSLLIQVAGRCGRGKDRGRVIIQTFDDENRIFEMVKGNDYESFYEIEIEERRLMFYPPFSRIVRLLFRGVDEEKVIQFSKKVGEILKERIETRHDKNDIKLLGPAPALFSKIAKNYRHHILIKSRKIEPLRDIIRDFMSKNKTTDVYMEIDIDPVDIL